MAVNVGHGNRLSLFAGGEGEILARSSPVSTLTGGHFIPTRPVRNRIAIIPDGDDPIQIRRAFQRLDTLASGDMPKGLGTTDTARAGYTTTFSRSDHIHPLERGMVLRVAGSDATPSAVSTTAWRGAGRHLSRDDHAHNLTSDMIATILNGGVLAIPSGFTVTGNIALSSGYTVDGVDVSDFAGLTVAEITQLENINTITISNAQWGYLGALDQALTQASSPSFADVSSATYTLETVGGVAAGNVTNIATNVTNITTNVTNIATNVTDIATNVTAIALNTTHRGSNGADHSYLDQAVTVASSPAFAKILAADGTAGAVSYGFQSQPNTGMFRIAESSIYWAVVGTTRMELHPDRLFVNGNITLVAAGTVDGVDIGAFKTAYDAHVADTANPHTVTKAQVGLTDVEDTALSTWAGTTNITTLGTIGTGVWGGSSIPTTHTDAKCVTVWPDTYTADQNLLTSSAPRFAGGTEIYANGADVELLIHEDAGANEARLRLRRGTTDWELVHSGGLAFEYEVTSKLTISVGGFVGVLSGQGIGIVASSRFLFTSGNIFVDNANLEFENARNMIFSGTTGTKIGTATTQKIGFWNVTPVVQPAHIADADGTLGDATTKINAILAQLATLGLHANA